MISLTAANVSLKPSQKKQLLSRLRRAIRLGERLGQFVLRITVKGCGRHMEVVAKGRDKGGEFQFRARQLTLADCMKTIVRTIVQRVHDSMLGITPLTPA
jgi:hypothetical protein